MTDYYTFCAHSHTIFLIFTSHLLILSLYYLLHHNIKTLMSHLKPCSSFLTCDSNSNQGPYEPHWGIAEPAESISWSNEIVEEKTSVYSLALNWLESKEIKMGNPDDIVDSFTSKQRESLKGSHSIQPVKLNSSSLLARRSKTAAVGNS